MLIFHYEYVCQYCYIAQSFRASRGRGHIPLPHPPPSCAPPPLPKFLDPPLLTLEHCNGIYLQHLEFLNVTIAIRILCQILNSIGAKQVVNLPLCWMKKSVMLVIIIWSSSRQNVVIQMGQFPRKLPHG